MPPWQWATLFIDIAALLCATLLCWVFGPGHSAFPDVHRGYHTRRAVQGPAQWEYANRAATYLCVYLGFPLLVVAPLFRWGFGAHGWLSAVLQAGGLLAFGLLVALVPNLLLRRLFPGGDDSPDE